MEMNWSKTGGHTWHALGMATAIAFTPTLGDAKVLPGGMAVVRDVLDFAKYIHLVQEKVPRDAEVETLWTRGNNTVLELRQQLREQKEGRAFLTQEDLMEYSKRMFEAGKAYGTALREYKEKHGYDYPRHVPFREQSMLEEAMKGMPEQTQRLRWLEGMIEELINNDSIQNWLFKQVCKPPTQLSHFPDIVQEYEYTTICGSCRPLFTRAWSR